MVVHLPFKQGVVGSNPTGVTNRGAEKPRVVPLLVLRGDVLFPLVEINVKLSTPYGKELIKRISQGVELAVFSLKKDQDFSYTVEKIQECTWETGILARVTAIHSHGADIFISITGIKRIRRAALLEQDNIVWCAYEVFEDSPASASDIEPLLEKIRMLINSPQLVPENYPLLPTKSPASFPLNGERIALIRSALEEWKGEKFVNSIATIMNISPERKQSLLEMPLEERTKQVLAILNDQIIRLKIEAEIHEKVKAETEQKQREAILLEEYHAIQRELGIGEENPDIVRLRQKASDKKMPPHVKEQFEKELERLAKVPPLHPEYPVIYSYLEWLATFPWGIYTKDTYDIERARAVLDETHWGLEKVKDRIIEYLAVMALNKVKKRKNPTILCFVGPPGVGKTSLGKAIAKSLNRPFVQMSLGGLKDEAEIRGHRRTYIGAMPGRIVQKIKKAGASNPVFVLDELDKVGADFRGDPSHALLEVLDPEQNNSFYDNYLECEVDLSEVLFIGTANTTTTIHPALLDRLEVIEIPGYTIEEKIQIAMTHLVNRALDLNGLDPGDVKFTEKTIEKIISGWTHEAGVRELQRKISTCVRKVIVSRIKEDKLRIPEKEDVPGEEDQTVSLEDGATSGKRASRKRKAPLFTVTPEKLTSLLGPPLPHSGKYVKKLVPGISIALAWTPTGGDILFIEAKSYKGKDRLILTGNMGKVMKESIQIALSLAKAYSALLPVKEKISGRELHIHIPEGAVPKDGPSAGIAIFTALVSLFIEKSLLEYIAMTGEITLSGYVLPVGGIKEKLLAARRNGIKTVILPEGNRSQVEEVEAIYKKDLELFFVERIEEVLNLAFGLDLKKAELNL